jgi:PAS domain S-box-containing protein
VIKSNPANTAWRYALAPLCIGVAVLLHLSPVGPLSHPIGFFILGVVAAAWLGGTGTGIFAAFLAAIVLPHLIAKAHPLTLAYPLLAGFFDLPGFVTLGLTGAAVGWGTSLLRRAQAALRERESELCKVRDELETKVAQRTAHLAASEERYALAMTASDQGFWDWDVVSDKIYASPRLVEMYGLPPGTRFAGREDFRLRAPFLPEDFRKWTEAKAAHFAGESERLDMEMQTLRDGETRWIHVTGLATRDATGNVVRWTGATSDITERKRAEEALRQSEKRYERAMLSADAGHWDWDVLTDDYYASPRLREMSGLPRDARFSGREDFMRQTGYPPEEREKWLQAVRQLFASEESRLAMELRAIVHGDLRWLAFDGICFRDADGKVLRWTGSATDVTERKRAEEALRVSEERYARAMEASDAGHWDWDLLTDHMFVSERAREMVALPAGPLPATRSEIIALVPMHPEDRESLRERVAAALVNGSYERDYRVIPRQGDLRWLRSRGKVFRDANGVAVRMTGSLVDINERKLAEEALRVSEQRYARAMEASEAGHFEWDIATDAMFQSARMKEMLGLAPDTHIANRLEFLARQPFLPGERERLEEAIRASFDHPDRRYEIDYRIRLPNGDVRWMRSQGKIFPDDNGTPVRLAGSMTDVTERHKVEDDLRSRQEMLELAQKSARAIAFEWKIGAGDGENRWSPDLEAMYGFAPGTYDGSFEMWKKLVHPQDWPAVKEAIRHAMSTGEVASEYRVVHSDRSVHWLQAKGRMFFDRAGNAIRMVGFMQDITQRKHAEDELRKMEQELRRAQRLEAMGTLAGGIAHDFNNILGAILGYGDVAVRATKKGGRLRRDLESIVAAGERGRALVDRILAFSRSGVGERVAVHVEAVVHEALDQLAAKLPVGVTIEPRLQAGRAAMLGDSTQVHQVVMNLATNAVQAMPNGGVLQVALEAMQLDSARSATVGTLNAGDYIVLKVSDAGIGIAPNVLERMFDPFFTTKEVGVGSGLGLSLVHGIVTSVGGAIDVATELGAGSTFTVYLPRSGDAPAQAANAKRPLPRGDGQRVLVVDDEEPLVRLASETLERLGYAPVSFTSSTAALAAFRANPQRFDAVLTDERMPGLSGSALIREVRGIRDAIPVVLMSGYLGMDNVDANVVVKKPLSARDLATSMARALER